MLDFHFINAPTCRDRAFKASKSQAGDGLAGVGERYPAELSVECVRVFCKGNYV